MVFFVLFYLFRPPSTETMVTDGKLVLRSVLFVRGRKLDVDGAQQGKNDRLDQPDENFEKIERQLKGDTRDERCDRSKAKRLSQTSHGVKQILTGRHWAEEPVSRTSHMLSNIEANKVEEHIEVRCRFLVYRNRTETEWDLFVGKREDRLRRVGDGFQIASRKIYLDQNVLLAKNLTVFF